VSIQCSAIIVGKYRYLLSRDWGLKGFAGRRVLWVMLNPSTADATRDDATIKKCTGFTMRWGCDGFDVVNMYGFRSTDPKQLAWEVDPIGPANDTTIIQALLRPDLWRVVVAWGAHHKYKGMDVRAKQVMQLINDNGRQAWCLKRTPSGGVPQHPLMVAYAQEPEPYQL
jgi:hypothetical protein